MCNGHTLTRTHRLNISVILQLNRINRDGTGMVQLINLDNASRTYIDLLDSLVLIVDRNRIVIVLLW